MKRRFLCLVVGLVLAMGVLPVTDVMGKPVDGFSTNSMQTQSVWERFRAIVVDVLEVNTANVILDADFYYDLGADDVDMYEIWYGVKEEFEVDIRLEEMVNIRTCRDLYFLILFRL